MSVASSLYPPARDNLSAGFTPLRQDAADAGPEDPLDGALVDQLLDERRPWLHFPPTLERQYLKDTAADRLRVMVVSGALVSLIFNWMLISDWLLIRDQFDLALRLRLFLYTPATLVGLFVLYRLDSPLARENLMVLPGAVAAAINTALCLASSDPMAVPYLVGLASIVMFSNSVARMRFSQAVILDALILVMFLIAATLMDSAPVELIVPAGLLLLSTVVFTLYGCYRQDRDERHNWLLHLRERLLLQDLEHTNHQLHLAARSDILTGVSNRRHFDEHLRELWAQAAQDGRELSVMMIDVDHFKAYNDRYGHPVGDACLKEVATALKRRLRLPGDLIARFGGEEFIAVLDGTPLRTAHGAAERVRKAVESLNLLHPTSSTHAVITVSIGVANARPADPGTSITRLIEAADGALYQAKQSGRNRVMATGGDA